MIKYIQKTFIVFYFLNYCEFEDILIKDVRYDTISNLKDFILPLYHKQIISFNDNNEDILNTFFLRKILKWIFIIIFIIIFIAIIYISCATFQGYKIKKAKPIDKYYYKSAQKTKSKPVFIEIDLLEQIMKSLINNKKFSITKQDYNLFDKYKRDISLEAVTFKYLKNYFDMQDKNPLTEDFSLYNYDIYYQYKKFPIKENSPMDGCFKINKNHILNKDSRYILNKDNIYNLLEGNNFLYYILEKREKGKEDIYHPVDISYIYDIFYSFVKNDKSFFEGINDQHTDPKQKYIQLIIDQKIYNISIIEKKYGIVSLHFKEPNCFISINSNCDSDKYTPKDIKENIYANSLCKKEYLDKIFSKQTHNGHIKIISNYSFLQNDIVQDLE
jgi:hypothetical protein